jgi:septal ring factor EnvC (AmiA/AmiB activator)
MTAVVALVAWPVLLAVPATLLAVGGVLAGLARLIVLAVRRDHSATALSIAKEVQDQQKKLIETQHDTNVDIDRRLTEIKTEKSLLETQVSTQASEIDNLKQGRAIQDHRLSRIEAERDWLRQRLYRILQWLTASGIALPDDLKDDRGAPKP